MGNDVTTTGERALSTEVRSFRSIPGLIRPRVPRAGKIRLGIKKVAKSGKEYPSEVDHFVFDEDLEGRDRIVELYGEKPKRILVTFLSDDPEEVFPMAYKAYKTGLGLYCKGDGTTAERLVTKEVDGRREPVTDDTGKPQTKEHECPCDFLKKSPKQCRAVGNLLVVLPEIGWASYQIDTGSYHSFQNVRNAIGYYAGFLGRVRGRLFWLERVPTLTHGSGREERHYPLTLRMLKPEEYQQKRDAIGDFIQEYGSLLGDDAPDAFYDDSPGYAEPSSVEVEDDIVRGQVVPDDFDEAETGGVDEDEPRRGKSGVEALNERLKAAKAKPQGDAPIDVEPEDDDEPEPSGSTDMSIEQLREAVLEPSIRNEVKAAAEQLGLSLAKRSDLNRLTKQQLIDIYDEAVPL